MKHRLLTWQIIIKMAAVLILIALFNFCLSHLFLKERLTSHMSEDIEIKKDLIVQLLTERMVFDPVEQKNKIENLVNESEEIEVIVFFQRNEADEWQLILGNESILENGQIKNALSSHLTEEQSLDQKIDGVSYRTFLVPVDDHQVIAIVANLERQTALENRIIFVDIFVTIFGFILVLFVLWTIARRELKPLGEIEVFLENFSKGDLSNRLHFDRKNHFAWLADRINDMAEKIYRLVKGVKEEADDQIEHMAFHDDLTDLPNRRKFREVVTAEIEKAKNDQQTEFAVMYLDLDGFKTVNDSLGHSYGDKLLVLITERLKAIIEKVGILARLGGDEFTAMIPLANIENKTEFVKLICKQLIRSFDKYFELEGDKISITISIGVALYPKDGQDHDTLLRNADAAMYVAKTSGKRQFVYYLPYMNEELRERIELERNLRNALENEELSLHYQPQINAKTGKIVGVEVLLRWFHKDFGMVPPGKFIPIMEKSNLINDVGEWVLRKACEQNKKWQEQGLDKISVSVNVSARQFQQADLVEMVETILYETGLDPKYLTIEITESTAMENIRESFEKMNALKRLGVHIAIDDFGTGHSSLRYLKSFPLDTLKIDRTFINDIDRFTNGTEIVTAIIALAHSLRIGLVAEGVEEEKQLKFLLDNNCNIIQGFLFSRPLPVQEFEQCLKEGKCVKILKEG